MSKRKIAPNRPLYAILVLGEGPDEYRVRSLAGDMDATVYVGGTKRTVKFTIDEAGAWKVATADMLAKDANEKDENGEDVFTLVAAGSVGRF